MPRGLNGTKPMPSSSSVGRISVSGSPPPQRVLALERRHRLDGVRATNRLRAGLRQPEVPDLALLNQLLHRSRDVLDGHVRIDAVLIEQVDRLDLEPPERSLGDFPDVRRPAVQAARLPASNVNPNLVAITTRSRNGRQGFADQLFVDVRAVGFGGVEERHASLDGRPNQGDHLLRCPWLGRSRSSCPCTRARALTLPGCCCRACASA